MKHSAVQILLCSPDSTSGIQLPDRGSSESLRLMRDECLAPRRYIEDDPRFTGGRSFFGATWDYHWWRLGRAAATNREAHRASNRARQHLSAQKTEPLRPGLARPTSPQEGCGERTLGSAQRERAAPRQRGRYHASRRLVTFGRCSYAHVHASLSSREIFTRFVKRRFCRIEPSSAARQRGSIGFCTETGRPTVP